MLRYLYYVFGFRCKYTQSKMSNNNAYYYPTSQLHFQLLNIFYFSLVWIRRFKQQDVPTSLEKSAPEFCTVYVIYKGKVQTMRSSNICHMPSPSTRTNLSSKSSRSYSSSNTKSSYSSGGSDTKSTTSSHSSSRSRGRGQPITPYKNPSR